jgi:PAS domain S-box-containing protein
MDRKNGPVFPEEDVVQLDPLLPGEATFEMPPLPRETFAASPNLAMLLRTDGHIVQVGGRCRPLLDVDEEEHEGRHFADLILPRDLSLVPDDLDRLVGWEDRQNHPLELHLRHGSGDGDEAEDGQMAGGRGQDDGRWRLFSISARYATLGGDRYLLLALQSVGRPGSWDVSRSMLLEAVEAANSCIVIADLKQKDQPLVYVNAGFRNLTGYEQHEVIGQNCRFLQRRGDGSFDNEQEGVKEIRNGIDRGEFVHTSIRNYSKDGDLFYNDLYLTPVRQDGELVAYIGVQNNVTHQIRLNQESQRRADAIQSFFDASPLIMGIVELQELDRKKYRSATVWAEATHVMINRTGIDFLGVTSGKLKNETLVQLAVPEETASQFGQAFADSVHKGIAQEFDCHLKSNPLQELRRIRVIVNAILTQPGEKPRCSYFAEDITEAAAVEDRRRLLEATVVNIDDAVVISSGGINDEGPKILYVNEGFTRLSGYTSDEIIGKTPRVLQGPLTSREVLDRARLQMEAGETFRGETTNYRKDGSPYMVAWTIAPVRDDEGNITNWVSAQRSTTERRQLERQVLEVQQREQERIARDLHDTVAQQLNTLTLYVGTVRNELKGVADQEQLDMLQEAVEQARAAADQARTLSHTLMPVPVEVGGLPVALERLAERSQLAFGVRCELVHQSPFGSLARDAAEHLFRIANEAVSNAMRHAQASHIEIRLLRDEQDGTGRLEIVDDGVGMPEPLQDSFGNTGKVIECGLGLSTMRYRVEIIGGSIEVLAAEPEADRCGTRVVCTFPLQTPDA